jgi:hypothetical protein
MARDNTGKFEEFVTEFGELVYPNFQVPRQFKGKGEFKYDGLLRLPEDSIIGEASQTPFREFVEQQLDMARAEFASKLPFHNPIKDAQADDKPATLTCKFSVNAIVKTKKGRDWERQPVIFDSRGVVVKDCPSLGTGTEARIRFIVYRWESTSAVGITLQPIAIQVRKLVERTEGGGGFDAVEGSGWQAEDQGGFVPSREQRATVAPEGLGAGPTRADF